MADHHGNIVICGAGIIGLTLARELARRGVDDVLVLDKEIKLGLHASGRNSGVLHAGIYYPPRSLKARICLNGNLKMQAYCKEHNLPLLASGKVIVAREASELAGLEELYERGKANGADVTLVDETELAEIEPNAKTVERALFSKYTAQIDPQAVLASLRSELEASGKVRFLMGAEVTGRARETGGANAVQTPRGTVGYTTLINAAGAHADKVAAHFGVGRQYRLVPFKGLYRKLRPERSHLIKGNIYPVPDIKNPFLGVHFTRSVHGEVYLGPTAIPALGRENYGVIAGLDTEAVAILWRDTVLFARNPKFRRVALAEPRKYRFRHFFRDASKLVKDLSPEDVLPSHKVGIRPQLVDLKTHELVMDFVIEEGERELHILNAISPAFTSSLAFAELVADKILD